MRQVVSSPRFSSGIALATVLAIMGHHALADDAPPADSALVRLLKSGRVPEARQGAIIEMIGKRGTAADLTFVYEQAVTPRGFSQPLKIKALEALAEAASNRGIRPEKNRDQLVSLIETKANAPATGLEKAAVQLAGVWKLDAAADALRSLAVSVTLDEGLRREALNALAAIGGSVGRGQIAALAGPGQPVATRMLAVAALAKLDINSAAARAVDILTTSQTPATDLTPLIAAFLTRQGGADVLAAAIGQHPLTADAAKLALRSVYALGRADAALVTALSRAAGLSAETRTLSPAELNQLVAEVAANGDPARGERVFRRADLNCMSCHAVSKAGGEVGPDLSSIGQTSPSDYIINSILNPDQAIKEQYHTLVVQTSDGQVFQGIVTDKDEQRIVLKEATGAPRVVPTASVEDQKPGGSLMPKGLANLMTRAEFVDLVRFLSELGKPGPYAIRSIPTIQRWRVLKRAGPGFQLVVRPSAQSRGRAVGRLLRQGRRRSPPRRRQGTQRRGCVVHSGRDQCIEPGARRRATRFAAGSATLDRRRAGARRVIRTDHLAGGRPPYDHRAHRYNRATVRRDQGRSHPAGRFDRRVHGRRRPLNEFDVPREPS